VLFVITFIVLSLAKMLLMRLKRRRSPNHDRRASMSGKRMAMHTAPQARQTVALTLAFGAMAFGVFWLVWILFETIRLGGGGLNWALFTESTPAAMSDGGGLANAIFGSVMMVVVWPR
jgi:ABC-type phosphate transport system permease subunit